MQVSLLGLAPLRYPLPCVHESGLLSVPTGLAFSAATVEGGAGVLPKPCLGLMFLLPHVHSGLDMLRKVVSSWALVAHSCNPRDQRIVVWCLTGQIVHEILSWKYSTQKRAGGVTQVIEHLPGKCPEFKPQYWKKKKKKRLVSECLLSSLQCLDYATQNAGGFLDITLIHGD
jgi:hypothetical protein